MWKNLNIQGIGSIEKCVAEFQVWAQGILPYGKMKIKVYESPNGMFCGYTDVRIIRKFDGCPEGAVGHGKTVDEALEDTLKHFKEIVVEDYPAAEYPNGLLGENIEYADINDF